MGNGCSARESVGSNVSSRHACNETVPCSPSLTACAEVVYVLPAQVPSREPAYEAACIVTVCLDALNTALTAFGNASVLRLRAKPATNNAEATLFDNRTAGSGGGTDS